MGDALQAQRKRLEYEERRAQIVDLRLDDDRHCRSPEYGAQVRNMRDQLEYATAHIDDADLVGLNRRAAACQQATLQMNREIWAHRNQDLAKRQDSTKQMNKEIWAFQHQVSAFEAFRTASRNWDPESRAPVWPSGTGHPVYFPTGLPR